MRSTKSADLIGHIKFLPWGQLDGCSVTRPFLSLQRVWLARLHPNMVHWRLLNLQIDMLLGGLGYCREGIRPCGIWIMTGDLNKSHPVKVRWKDAYKPTLTIELYLRVLSQMASIGQTGLHLVHRIVRPSSSKIHPKGDASMTYTMYCTKVSVPWLTRLPDKLDNFSWAL